MIFYEKCLLLILFFTNRQIHTVNRIIIRIKKEMAQMQIEIKCF